MKKITDATSEANDAIVKIKTVSKVIVIGALGAAIMSGNADGALKATENLGQAATD